MIFFITSDSFFLLMSDFATSLVNITTKILLAITSDQSKHVKLLTGDNYFSSVTVNFTRDAQDQKCCKEFQNLFIILNDWIKD